MSKKVIRCEICNGSKSILGLGNMLQSCKACSGVGYCNDNYIEEEFEIEDEPEVITTLVAKKKPGRKPSQK